MTTMSDFQSRPADAIGRNAASRSQSDISSLTRRGLLGAAAAGSVMSLLPNAGEAATPPAIAHPTDDAIVPFHIAIPQSELEDLKVRLIRTRWPEKETVQDWSQGAPFAKAQALIAAWRDQYDWRIFEQRVNQLPQFMTNIDGLDFYFIH